MKRNKTFFITVITLIIASLTALSGIMFAIASNNGESKPHITDENTFDLSANSTVIEDSPTPQTEMQEKFYSMYSIDESTNTITVISEEYLKDFWQSNYQSEVIHTLTVDEVMFIIQDSVRLYFEYDTIILPAFFSISSNYQVSERFPSITEQIITPNLDSQEYRSYYDHLSAIHSIILYRIQALSSPKAFFEIIYHSPPEVSFPDIRTALYYFPQTSNEITAEELYAKYHANDIIDTATPVKFFRIGDTVYDKLLFSFISYFSTDGSNVLSLFPNEQTEILKYLPDKLSSLFLTDSVHEMSFHINWQKKSFTLNINSSSEVVISGKYELHIRDKKYVLTGESCNGEEKSVYVLYYSKENEFIYSAQESTPAPEFEIEDGTVFKAEIIYNQIEDIFHTQTQTASTENTD